MSGFTAQRYFDGLMGLPSSGPITSQFGTRRDYNNGALRTFHSGTDFGGGPGTPVVAPAAGVVVLAETLPVRGNATIIDHGWGVYTGYWHQMEIDVTVGQVVTPGQIIGTIGSSGRVTGPHLHWEMWVGGVQVDPLQWVRQSFP
jgi:murein DD-endopeptidase MepM/ murein hydrolase activator NlpD